MEFQSRRERFNLRTLLDFNDIDKNTQTHLKNVYGMLSIGLLSAFAGAYSFMVSAYLQSIGPGLMTLSFFASIGALMYIYFVQHTQQTIVKRSMAYLAFTSLTGLSLGPLLRVVAFIDPSIIPTALFGTAMIFVSFTVASLFTRNRYYLYLAGSLMTACSLLSTMMLVNLFVRSATVNTASLYIGFGVFCAFIIFDTQMMVQKRKMGDTDFIWHSVDLFIDFVEVFVRLVAILTEKRNNRREE